MELLFIHQSTRAALSFSREMSTIAAMLSKLVLFAVFLYAVKAFQPPECLDQTGSCDWYINCLESTFHCSSSNYSYPIGFAHPICLRFDGYKEWFSERGRVFSLVIKRCLQQRLAEELKKLTSEPTCQEIEELGFGVHDGCYLDNKFCEIITDWPTLIVGLRDAFISRRWRETWSSATRLLTRCATDGVLSVMDRFTLLLGSG